MEDDATLFDRWAEGDRDAGNLLIRRHFQTVFRFFRTKVAADVDDLIQRTFLASMEARTRFRRESSFRAFVLGLARIELLMHYRRSGREGERIEPSVTTVHDLKTSVSDLVVRHEEHRLLQRALRRIPLDLQIVLELRYWEQLSSRELGEVLAIPAPTVRSRLRRARELLAEQVRQVASTPELGESIITGLDAWASSLRDVVDKG